MLSSPKSLIFTLVFLAIAAVTPDLSEGRNPYLGLTERFISGATNTHGSLQDRLIEGAIEAATPDADERTRHIQRSAVKYLVSKDAAESRKHWGDLERGIRETVRAKGITDQEQTRVYRQNAPASEKSCRIVNYGKPPGRITIKKGCFNRECTNFDGVFTINMGWGVSGLGEGIVVPIEMVVSVKGNRSEIHQDGFQTLNWFENVTVSRKGDILVFAHDEKTTIAMGDKANRELVKNHRYFGARGEYFSLLLPPDANSSAIVHFGILEAGDELRRVCR